MRYYVAFDGGGSKIAAILYDENLHMISHAMGSSMNTSSTSREQVTKNSEDVCAKLLEGTGVTEVECCYGVFPRILSSALANTVKLNRLDDRGGEGLVGFLAAGIRGDNAIMTLSGTGSVIFYNHDGRGDEAGGYGSVVHDEGSGYHMGRMAFAAAIKDFEQRGPKTLISEEICKKLGAEDIGEAAYKIYNVEGKSPIAAVASVAPCVGKAARRGDPIAAELLRECGINLAEQTLGLIRRCKAPIDVPVVLAGGHFKNDRRISDALIAHIEENDPGRKVIIPYFEPIVGSVMVRLLAEEDRMPTPEEREFMKREYEDFRFRIHE